VAAVVGEDHRQRGRAALHGLHLDDRGHAHAAPGRRERTLGGAFGGRRHHDPPKTYDRSERRPTSTLTGTTEPTRSASSSPSGQEALADTTEPLAWT
jgi:hypothetical protein